MKVLIVTQIGIWLPGVIRIIIIQPMDKKFNLLCATQIATVTDYGFHEEFHTIASSNVYRVGNRRIKDKRFHV